jgi:signal transduction histidine kinase
VRAAGISVGLTVTADAALPPSVALTVYRIVQEALTNVVKHASNAHALVRVRTDADGVRVTVTDTGRGRPAAAAGRGGTGARHGIVGMRERAAAFGGTLDAGVLPGGGFQVRAFLPVAEPVAPLAERVAPAAAQPVPDAAIGQPT